MYFRYENYTNSVSNDITFWIRDEKHVKYFAIFSDYGFSISDYLTGQDVKAKSTVVTTKEDWIYFVGLLKRLYDINVPIELRY